MNGDIRFINCKILVLRRACWIQAEQNVYPALDSGRTERVSFQHDSEVLHRVTIGRVRVVCVAVGILRDICSAQRQF